MSPQHQQHVQMNSNKSTEFLEADALLCCSDTRHIMQYTTVSAVCIFGSLLITSNNPGKESAQVSAVIEDAKWFFLFSFKDYYEQIRMTASGLVRNSWKLKLFCFCKFLQLLPVLMYSHPKDISTAPHTRSYLKNSCKTCWKKKLVWRHYCEFILSSTSQQMHLCEWVQQIRNTALLSGIHRDMYLGV